MIFDEKAKIIRKSNVNLDTIRGLHGPDADVTAKLQKYVLGLCLVGITRSADHNLRQGCHLVHKFGEPIKMTVVKRSGERVDMTIEHSEALAFATVAAKNFGVGPSESFSFDRKKADKAIEDVKGKKKGKKKSEEPDSE